MLPTANAYRRLVVLTWIAATIVMIAGVDREMASILWGGQHDEKLSLWAARAAFLGPPHTVWDVQPPGSVLGWLGPKLSLVGFWIFGLDDAGLRFPFLVISALGLLCFGLACERVAPGPLGFLVFLTMALNLTTIAVGRTALLENVASASMAVLLWFWTCHRQRYVAYASWVAFGCGALVLVKPNFVVYAYMLHACLLAASDVPLRSLARHAFFCAVALAAWMGIHVALLALDGVLSAYSENLGIALRDHLGAHDSSTAPLLYKVGSYGLTTTAYQMGFWLGAWIVGWHANAPRTDHPYFEAACVAVPVVLLAGCVARLVRRRPFARVPDDVWALSAFLVVNWLVASQMFFALKRAYPFFFVALVLAAMLLKIVWDLGRGARVAVATALLALHVVRLDSTREFLFANGAELYTRNVEENSRTLDQLLPEGTELYAYGLAARFVWMSHRRIFSWDDQWKNNQMILDEAIARHATYVLLADPSTIPADYVGGFRPPVSVELELVHTFVTTPADSDYPMKSFLVALHPERASEATLQRTDAP
jgi:hypothetical protein